MNFRMFLTKHYTILTVFCHTVVHAKTVSGVFSSLVAQVEFGQYLSSYCFHGEALVKFDLNTTGYTPAKLYLYISEDWRDVQDETDCANKLQKSRIIHEMNTTSGNFTVSHFNRPCKWHLLYADAHTCDEGLYSETANAPNVNHYNFIQYNITLLNPDSLGNPTEHFGDEETGLLRFYQLLTLAYFVLSCIFAPRLWQTLSKGGPMQLVIQLLSASICLQAIGSFLMMVHLIKYSYNGIGSPFKEVLSEFFDVLSQFAMLYMLLSLSLGWTLASAHCRYSHLKTISRRPASKVVAVLGILQGGLFMWEQFQDSYNRMFHAHRSNAGIALVILRILLAGLFAWNLHTTISAERSTLKREFYGSFTRMCMLWFLCYPAIVVTSWIFPECLHYKMVIMGVLLCQSAAGAFLYRLFLSRSLYWEVSALSSSLPLRFDRNFSIKIYS
ncbi:integral membrane protein GPR180-like [Gigantopelta aegis]|uniref:integral membrane protein GPR180-like n=1 Tax=Gigantopelta aegis TaxID=1735272 RepID=UPI001B88E1B5|nr:integral membrane protein GPR180-like [Gigantopelta aegis]